MVLQRHDGGHYVEGLQAGMEALDFEVDDGFRPLGFFSAIGYVGGDRLLQVIDVVDEDAVELVHLRIDVARHGDIDEEHGPVFAAAGNVLRVHGGNGVRGAGRSDHDVGAVAGVIEIVEVDRLPFEFLGQLMARS